MFKNGQLVLLPQHMWEENKEGREAYSGRKTDTSEGKREREKERERNLWSQASIVTFDPQRAESWKGNILSEINTEETNTCLDASCVEEASVAWPKTKLTPTQGTQREIKRQKDKRDRNSEEKEKEKNQSETVIRLQSILLSDLFRILNRGSRSTKTKDETIIR